MPDPVTEPPTVDPVYEALLYCNIPSVAEHSMEGRPGAQYARRRAGDQVL